MDTKGESRAISDLRVRALHAAGYMGLEDLRGIDFDSLIGAASSALGFPTP